VAEGPESLANDDVEDWFSPVLVAELAIVLEFNGMEVTAVAEAPELSPKDEVGAKTVTEELCELDTVAEAPEFPPLTEVGADMVTEELKLDHGAEFDTAVDRDPVLETIVEVPVVLLDTMMARLGRDGTHRLKNHENKIEV
jgi:hypothetical protein